MMKLFQGLRAHVLLLLVTLALVGCDSSVLTAFNAPATATPSEVVSATVDHEWQFDVTDFDNTGEAWDMVFVLGLPAGWDVSNTVTYNGTLGGNPVSVTLDRLPGPPAGNFEVGLSPTDLAEYEMSSCSYDPSVFPGTLTPVFFQASAPFTVNAIQGESGTFSFDLVASSQVGAYDFQVAHGLYATFTDFNGPAQDLTSCWYFLEPPPGQQGDAIINSVLTRISVLGAAVGAATVAVPVGGAWLALLMALGLIGTGMWFGWRRDRASKT